MGVAAEDGLVTYHYEVLRPVKGTDPRYVVYLMKSSTFTGELIRKERGIGAGGTSGVRTTEVPFSSLRTIDAFIPSPAEQCLISDYLDRETGQIDELITQQDQLVATLTERLETTWAAQLDELSLANTSLTLRRIIDSIVDGPFGSSLTSAHYVDEGVRVIRLGNLGINQFKSGDEAYVSIEHGADLAAHSVSPGDVLVAGLGDEKMPLGRATVAPSNLGPAIVKADCYRLRLNGRVDPDFLAWALSSPQLREQFKLLSRGSTRQRLNTAVVREAQIPLPPLEVQRSVIVRFNRSREKSDALVEKAVCVVKLLRERRQALISAAVTGKIDVRDL